VKGETKNGKRETRVIGQFAKLSIGKGPKKLSSSIQVENELMNL